MKLTNNEQFFFIGKDGKCDNRTYQQDELHCMIVEILGVCSDMPIDDFDISSMKKKIQMLAWMKRHEAKFEPGKNNWFVYYDFRYNSHDVYYTQFDKDVGKIYMSKEDCEKFIIEFDGGIGLI